MCRRYFATLAGGTGVEDQVLEVGVGGPEALSCWACYSTTKRRCGWVARCGVTL